MHSFAPTRSSAAAIAIFSLLPFASLFAQSHANATRAAAVPTSLPVTAPATPLPPPTPSQLPPRLAQVAFTSGTLSITADNSSLNQILRDISRKTGIKIVGGVADERVFGQYGPDVPAQILAALLDGTGSNVLLVHSDGVNPAQLILTPRQGGPTPPNPNAAALEEREQQNVPPSAPPAETAPAKPDQSQPAANPASTPATTAPAPTDPSQPNNPGGAKTPQQIYEQLQLLRQQQQQPQPPSPN